MASGRFFKKANIILSAATDKHAKYRCGLCDSSDKVSFTCEQCQVNLCSNCIKAHARIQTTSDHKVHPLLDKKGQEQKDQVDNGHRTEMASEFCKIHPKEELKL